MLKESALGDELPHIAERRCSGIEKRQPSRRTSSPHALDEQSGSLVVLSRFPDPVAKC